MDTQPQDVPAFDPFDPGFLEDPYTRYRVARENDPVHQTPFGGWTLFRYEDVVKVLHDSRQSVEFARASSTPMLEYMQAMAGDRQWRRDRSMLNIDPPDHTRLRKLVQKAFTPRSIRELAPRIGELVDRALDAAAERGRMDVIADLAFPLPFQVISDMLGMPSGEAETLRAWSGALVKTLDPILTPEEWQAAFDAAEGMESYVGEVIADKRRHPGDDMLTALVRAEDEGDVLDDDELRAQVVLLYVAGHETTVNLIGNGTLALLRNPAELERWRDDPSLDANATEELLRYDSPVQFSRRIVVEPLEVGGVPLEPGAIVLTSLGSANRDPARFGPDADDLRLGRAEAAQHVSFGGGVHFCLGAALARLEGRIAIGSLIRRFPSLEVAADRLRWNGRINLRGLEALPVTL